MIGPIFISLHLISLVAIMHIHSARVVGRDICDDIDCRGRKLLFPDESVFHVVVACEHESSYELLVQKVCEVLQYCIEPENLFVVLNEADSNTRSTASTEALNPSPLKCTRISDFLLSRNISYIHWRGGFSPDEKMLQTYSIFRGLQDSRKVIYHTDVDEFPDRRQFSKALAELRTGTCDAIRGYWTERVSANGGLNRISLSPNNGSLEDQFPLRCSISTNVVRGGNTKKVVAYRANLRIDGGQHEVWCEPKSHHHHTKQRTGFTDNEGQEQENSSDNSVEQRWNMTEACTAHIHARAKRKYENVILAHLPVISSRPRYCRTKVRIDHYKFVYGLELYLTQRVTRYKQLGLHWYRDSEKFLDHLNKYEGSLCVDCPTSRCYNTKTKQKIEANHSKTF